MPRARITKPVAPDEERFGKRLKELREKHGFTLRALADATGMSLAFISDLERGLKLPSLTTLLRLAVALDCKVTALVAPFDKANIREMLPK
ncbi:MAG TPA: helix-turn-helix transcriptional regulator [Thermoanaerobaculia bacterium]